MSIDARGGVEGGEPPTPSPHVNTDIRMRRESREMRERDRCASKM
jgi:hypothetical protein